MSTLTVEQAVERLRTNAGAVRVTIDAGDDEDMVMFLTNDGGAILSESVAGWAAGVVEPVCAADSDYLTWTLSREGRTLEDAERAVPYYER